MIEHMKAVVESLRPKIEAVKWENDEAYAMWLSQAYYIARRSTSFLGLCLFHAHKIPAFQKRCTQHIAEETGHEKLIENDLKQLGLPLLEELPSTMAIYKPQEYAIVSEGPLSFVGYIFLLELLAPAYGPHLINRVKNKKALSFLKVHTSADEDHIESATKILNTMSEEEQRLAMANFEMTALSYSTMLDQIARKTASVAKAA